jgi:hypothetical protein
VAVRRVALHSPSTPPGVAAAGRAPELATVLTLTGDFDELSRPHSRVAIRREAEHAAEAGARGVAEEGAEGGEGARAASRAPHAFRCDVERDARELAGLDAAQLASERASAAFFLEGALSPFAPCGLELRAGVGHAALVALPAFVSDLAAWAGEAPWTGSAALGGAAAPPSGEAVSGASGAGGAGGAGGAAPAPAPAPTAGAPAAAASATAPTAAEAGAAIAAPALQRQDLPPSPPLPLIDFVVAPALVLVPLHGASTTAAWLRCGGLRLSTGPPPPTEGGSQSEPREEGGTSDIEGEEAASLPREWLSLLLPPRGEATRAVDAAALLAPLTEGRGVWSKLRAGDDAANSAASGRDASRLAVARAAGAFRLAVAEVQAFADAPLPPSERSGSGAASSNGGGTAGRFMDLPPSPRRAGQVAGESAEGAPRSEPSGAPRGEPRAPLPAKAEGAPRSHEIFFALPFVSLAGRIVPAAEGVG